MKNTVSNRSADVRNVELLENRQLFAGYAADGAGFFPHPVPANAAVNIERIIAIEVAMASGQFPFGNPGLGAVAGATSGDTSASTPVTTRASQSSDVTTRSTLSVADSTTPVKEQTLAQAPAATPAISLVTGDDASAPAAQPATSGPMARTGTPTAPVVLAVDAQKVFAERPMPAAVVAQMAAKGNTSSLTSYLATPAAYEMSAYQAPATRSHVAQVAAAAEEQTVVAGVKLEKGPQHATLAAVPAGNLLSQPLWQRIAAASATVVILAVNWMLRRRREKLQQAPRRAV